MRAMPTPQRGSQRFDATSCPMGKSFGEKTVDSTNGNEYNKKKASKANLLAKLKTVLVIISQFGGHGYAIGIYRAEKF